MTHNGSMHALTPIEIAHHDDEMAFTQFASFNEHGFGVFRIAESPGAGPWEMHPDTDELLYVLEGTVTVERFDPSGNQLIPLGAGQLVVIPRNHWHRHVDAVDLIEMFYTPGVSLHCDDPGAEQPAG